MCSRLGPRNRYKLWGFGLCAIRWDGWVGRFFMSKIHIFVYKIGTKVHFKLWGFSLSAIRWVGCERGFLVLKIAWKPSKELRFWLGCHQVRRLGGTSADSASWRTRGEEAASRQQIFQNHQNFQSKIYLGRRQIFPQEEKRQQAANKYFQSFKISCQKYIWAVAKYL